MDYFEPKTVSEALSLLAKHGAEAKVIAGGTDVMVDIKYKEEPGSLVNIKKIPGLTGIKENGGSLRIGALTTIRDLETNALVREKAAGALGSGASVCLAAGAQHGNHRRQHLPGVAVGRNPGAAARVGSERQVRFLGRRERSTVHVVFSGTGKVGSRRDRSPHRNRRSLSSGRQQKRLFEACSARRHGYRHGRRRRPDHAGCREKQHTRCPHRSGRRGADADSRAEDRSDAARQAAHRRAAQRSRGDGRIGIEPDQRPAQQRENIAAGSSKR